MEKPMPMMLQSREQKAGRIYEEGSRAVSAGGDQLYLLASHLTLMIEGTSQFPGALWPSRIQHDGKVFKHTRFIDYLLKPVREGLGLPSLHFLRQVLKASLKKTNKANMYSAEKAYQLVVAELAKDGIDFERQADSERDAAMPEWRRAVTAPKYLHHDGNNVPITRPHRGNSLAWTLDRLERERKDLFKQVVAGELSANAAAIEAGFRKKPTPMEIVRKQLPKLTSDERQQLVLELQRLEGQL